MIEIKKPASAGTNILFAQYDLKNENFETLQSSPVTITTAPPGFYLVPFQIIIDYYAISASGTGLGIGFETNINNLNVGGILTGIQAGWAADQSGVIAGTFSNLTVSFSNLAVGDNLILWSPSDLIGVFFTKFTVSIYYTLLAQ